MLSVLLMLKSFVYQDFSTAISNYYSCSHNSYNGKKDGNQWGKINALKWIKPEESGK
jgi:hypothetical protein